MPGIRDALQFVLATLLEHDPDPATRSFTVLETRTSEGPASASTGHGRTG
jgi:hypothetical protein